MAGGPVRRIERDTMGELEVPDGAYYGASTMRAVKNFPASGLQPPVRFVRALGMIKLAAAKVNADLGLLDQKLADAIVKAAQEIVDGKQRRPVRGGRPVPDRLRHLHQHERQRGDREPRDRAARRRDRLAQAGPPERPRQHLPVLQRRDPERDPARRADRHQGRPDPGPGEAPGGAGAEGRGADAGHQDRPHPPPGRHAGPARAGVPGVRRPGRARPPAAASTPRRSSATCRSAGRPSAPASTPTRSSRRAPPGCSPRWPASRSGRRTTTSRPRTPSTPSWRPAASCGRSRSA